MLNLGELIGFGAGGGGPFSGNYVNSYVYDSGSVTNHTFASCDFGAVDDGRYIAVGIALGTASSTTINSVTIGGVTATKVVGAEGVSAPGPTAIFIAHVPSGTTGDIYVAASSTFGAAIAIVHRILNPSSATPDDTDLGYDNTDPTIASGSLNVVPGGYAIAVVSQYTSSSTGFTWTGLTEDTDQNPANNNALFSGASLSTTTTESLAFTATPTVTSAGGVRYSAAFWR